MMLGGGIVVVGGGGDRAHDMCLICLSMYD